MKDVSNHCRVAFQLADVDRVMTLEAVRQGAVPNPF